MKIKINKPQVVIPPDTITMTISMEEASALKTFALLLLTTHAASAPTETSAAAKRLMRLLDMVKPFNWEDPSKLFLSE